MATFSQQVEKWAKKTGITMENAVKAIRVQVLSGVIRRSPVLDSGLVQSWIATTGEPSHDVVDVPEGDRVNGESAKAKAISEAVKIAQSGVDSIFWLTNNKPYVRRIEYEGWSKIKAPEGMVRITLQELKTGLEKLLKNV